MKILGKSTIKGISSVYIAETENKDGLIEFVDVEPVIDEKRIKKWVIILSTQIGCPASCIICDAGGSFLRKSGFSLVNSTKGEVFLEVLLSVIHPV